MINTRLSAASSSSQEIGLLGQNEDLLKERLDNITKRGMNGSRSELVPSTRPGQRRYSVVQPLLERLREIRTGFGDAVGLPIDAMPEGLLPSSMTDPQEALKEELELWNHLEERMQYDMKRREQLPNRDQLQNWSTTSSFVVDQSKFCTPNSSHGSPSQGSSSTFGRNPNPPPSPRLTPTIEAKPTQQTPIPGTGPSPKSSPNLSPMSSPLLGISPSSEDWFGSPINGRLNRTSTASSASGIPLTYLDAALVVTLLVHSLVKVLRADIITGNTIL